MIVQDIAPNTNESMTAMIDRVTAMLGHTLDNSQSRREPGGFAGLGLAAPDPLALDRLANRDLARYIDHTLLKPEVTAGQIEQFCAEAREFSFAAVCVNPLHIARCVSLLQGTPVRVASVAGFPLGATTARIKAFETAECIAAGAHEIDMVMNIGALRDGDYAAVRADMEAVVRAASNAPVGTDAPASGRPLVKVIIETGFLTDEEKVAACLLARAAGIDFVKTSTGITTTGATDEDVRLMRRVVGEGVGVKAAGGIRDVAVARALLAAGASRLGTSASLAIVTASRT